MAADWSVVPSVTQRSEFNSNLNLAYTHPVSDYIFSFQPTVDFNYTSEISQLQGHMGLLGLHYITNSNLDHIDQNYQINGKYQIAPRVNLILNSAYTSDTTLAQELLASGLVASRSPRQSFQVGPGVTYNLTEKLLGTVNYNFNRVIYQSPQYTDYTSQQAGLNFTYLLKNEKTSLVSNNIVRDTLYAGGNDFKSLGLYGGVTHKFTERWDASLMSGANISFFSTDTEALGSSQFNNFTYVKTKENKSSNVTPYVNISTTYRWTNLLLNGGYSRDLSPGENGVIYEFNRLYLTCGYNITERLSGTLNGSYSLSDQTSQNISSKYNYYNVGPQLSYKITEKFSVSTGYSYSGSGNLVAPGGSGHVHQAWVEFAYAYPLHYQK
ncbi:MAG: hypothetical protein WBV23_06145 [Desulfobaccales bacterium]